MKNGFFSMKELSKEVCARAKNRRRVEKLLGYKLPPTAQIHHIDGNPHNNENSNLVVCQDRVYHFLLHKRKKIGDAWKVFCEAYDKMEEANVEYDADLY